MPSGLTGEELTRTLAYLGVMIVSLTFHEAAHAAVATVKGDDTASSRGRLSLNPIRHIDPIGTLVLPLAGALSGLPIIGWAKPVPVDLSKLKNPRWDHLQIAIAGPLANLLLAAVGIVGAMVYPEGPGAWLWKPLTWTNAYLGVFNLLPLPPLDGGAVTAALLPPALARPYVRTVGRYGYFILFMLFATHQLDWMGAVAGSYVQWLRSLFVA